MKYYNILALKWRPKNFKDFIGHTSVVNILNNSLKLNKIYHSYLFYGPRGVGKTSLARLLSKSLNCILGITFYPCNNCINCININLGKSTDVVEIDAASRTKIEDTRDFLDKVHYLPITMRYKIYIIDEVHMLSRYSFNALLKTLEEPPKHIKFILATTELDKIPDTIISRCMCFYLKPLKNIDILNRLIYIMSCEKILFDYDALKIISLYSKGSMRDSLVLVDQLLMFSGKNIISLKDLNIVLDIIDDRLILLFLKFLFTKNIRNLFKLLNFFYIKNINYINLLDSIINMLHNLYILNIFPNDYSDFDISDRILKNLFKINVLVSLNDLFFYYKLFLSYKNDMNKSYDKKISFDYFVVCALSH